MKTARPQVPVVLFASAGRLVFLWLRRRDLATAQRLLLLLILCGASALSIAYFPDFIKISFIAFIFLIAAAENLEWTVGVIPAPSHLKQGLAWLAVAVLLIAGAGHLYETWFNSAGRTPFPTLTVPADNPTRYGFFFFSDYHTPDEVQEVLDILAARKLPYVVVLPALLKPHDPILGYIFQEYESMSPTPLAGRGIYRRKSGA